MKIKQFTGVLLFLTMATSAHIVLAGDGGSEPDPYLSHYTNISVPIHLHVIDTGDMNFEELQMIISLQGVLAQTKPRIYITDKSNRDSYTYWLESIKVNHGVTTEDHTDAMAMLEEFKDEVAGYLLTKGGSVPGGWGTAETNAATTLAGIKGGIVISEAIQSDIDAMGLEMIHDVRGMTNEEVFNDYQDQLNNNLLITQNHNIMQLRDYAIATKAFVYHETAEESPGFIDEVYSWVAPDSPQFGWGWAFAVNEKDEHEYVGDAGRYGVFTNPSDWVYNLSTLAGVMQDSLKQNRVEATTDNIDTPEEAHYLAINMSDGDNYSFVLQGLADDGLYFDSESTGKFPMNWTIPGSMIDLAPAAMQWYYQEASEHDYFVIGGTGSGYMFPSEYPDLDEHVKIVNDYMGRSNLSYVGMLDPVDFGTSSFYETASKYTAQPNIKGVYYLNYWRYEGGDGQITFIDGKPVIAMRENMWGLNDNQIISLAEKINNHSRNLRSPEAYSIMNLHAWTHDLSDAELLVAHLDDHVKVVTMDELFQQVVKNVDPDYDPADDLTFGDNILPNHDFSDGFNNWRLVKDHSDANIQDVEEVFLGGDEGQTLTYIGYDLIQVFSDQLEAEPGKYYKIRVKAQVFGEHDNQANYKIRFYDQSREFIDEVNKFMPVNTDEFVYVEAAMQAPGNAVYMDVELAVWKDDPSFKIEVDEVHLMREVEVPTSRSEQLTERADRFQLRQNYPNPFNPTTRIEFSIAEPSNVTLEVFNIQGQRVATLVNKTKSAGVHTVNFHAASLSSGMYIYRLQAGNYSEVKKMSLIK